MADLDDIRGIVRALPGVEERATTGGAAWFVRRRLFAWECHPWPSIPEPVREVIASELVFGVKIAAPEDAIALREMQPDVFLPQTTRWGEPKVAFRLEKIDPGHLRELVTEAWLTQAPRSLTKSFPEASGN